MFGLKHPYPSVRTESGLTYGGSQMLSPDGHMRECGCGVVAALDSLLYMGRYQPRLAPGDFRWTGEPLEREEYERLLQQLRREYLPLVYPFGVNGITLAAGLNRLFRKENIPLRARWVMRRSELWPGLYRMLSEDMPVILSAGPNFPLLLSRKNKVAFCRKDAAGVLRPATSVNAHYVTVTGREGNYLRLSSWGREYYMDIRAYTEYIEEHSSYIMSNILLLERKERL